MTTTNDGGPAFPVNAHILTSVGETLEIGTFHGMSLRDWFAGQVMAGTLANAAWNTEAFRALGIQDSDAPMLAAKIAYLYADAMLAQRDKTGNE